MIFRLRYIDGDFVFVQFPDMIHALKPNPKSHIQEPWRIMDFFSHVPEACNMFTFVFDDIGIPADYRHMEGFGVHTFKVGFDNLFSHRICRRISFFEFCKRSSGDWASLCMLPF